MKVRVLNEFRDINKFSLLYAIGEEHDFEDERAESLISRGLAESIEERNLGKGEGESLTPGQEKLKRGRKPAKNVD